MASSVLSASSIVTSSLEDDNGDTFPLTTTVGLWAASEPLNFSTLLEAIAVVLTELRQQT